MLCQFIPCEILTQGTRSSLMNTWRHPSMNTCKHRCCLDTSFLFVYVMKYYVFECSHVNKIDILCILLVCGVECIIINTKLRKHFHRCTVLPGIKIWKTVSMLLWLRLRIQITRKGDNMHNSKRFYNSLANLPVRWIALKPNRELDRVSECYLTSSLFWHVKLNFYINNGCCLSGKMSLHSSSFLNQGFKFCLEKLIWNSFL